VVNQIFCLASRFVTGDKIQLRTPQLFIPPTVIANANKKRNLTLKRLRIEKQEYTSKIQRPKKTENKNISDHFY